MVRRGAPVRVEAGDFRVWVTGLFFLLTLPAAAASARPAGQPDIEAGKELYDRCIACHSVEHHRVGPRHCGLSGRKAGSQPGFAYTQAMLKSGLTWNRETLDRFLADPLKTVPGTSMTYDGVKTAEDRRDLIGYLQSLPACN